MRRAQRADAKGHGWEALQPSKPKRWGFRLEDPDARKAETHWVSW